MAFSTSGIDFVSWPGVASSAFGGVFWLFSHGLGSTKRFLESAHEVDKLSDLKGLSKKVPQVVAVRGKAFSDMPILGELSGHPTVMTQFREEHQCMRRRGDGEKWERDSSTVRHTNSEAHWGLRDRTGVYLPLINGFSANPSLPYLVENYVPDAQQGIFKQGLDLFSGFKSLGLSSTERSLLLGTQLTCVGELGSVPKGSIPCQHAVSAPQGHILVLRSPSSGRDGGFFITQKSLPELIQSYSGMARTCKWVAIGFGAVGVGLLAWRFGNGIAEVVRRKGLRRRVEAANRRLAEARAAGETVAEEPDAEAVNTGDREAGLCVICLEHGCEAVFASCGHMCACWACAQRCSSCPLCRTRTHAIKVFRP